MSQTTKLDLITFEVLRHRLWEINDEMAMLAARISGSPAVYESNDFNAAILTASGEGLFTGVYVIRQASALDVLVQSVIERFKDDCNDGLVCDSNGQCVMPGMMNPNTCTNPCPTGFTCQPDGSCKPTMSMPKPCVQLESTMSPMRSRHRLFLCSRS